MKLTKRSTGCRELPSQPRPTPLCHGQEMAHVGTDRFPTHGRTIVARRFRCPECRRTITSEHKEKPRQTS